MIPANKHKYRPYFTGEEMTELILALKSNPTPRNLGIIQYLEGFSVKINHGLIGASLSVQPSMEEKLTARDIPESYHVQASERLFNKWKLKPESCTPSEIQSVMEYRFSHDLMSPQEEDEYLGVP